MLHIILFILKIIGIILAAILGILVLLLCIVLFVPVRYVVSAESDGTIDGIRVKVRITWLLHLIRVVMRFEERKLEYAIRIAWKNGKKKKGEAYGSVEEKAVETEKETVEEVVKESSEIYEEYESDAAEIEEEPRLSEGNKAQQEEIPENAEKSKTLLARIENLWKKIKAFFYKWKQMLRKLKCTFAGICDKIKLLLEKKDKALEFIEDEIHRAAFYALKKEVVKFIKRLKPKKLVANIRYGFKDPCVTGQVLAGLSIIYPFIGEHANITPDFEQQVLEGDFFMKGKIHVLHLTALLWNLGWRKEVRKTYKDIRNFGS